MGALGVVGSEMLKCLEERNFPTEKLTLLDKLVDHATEDKLTAKECKALAAFTKGLGGEFLIQVFTGVQKAGNMKNLLPLNKIIGSRCRAGRWRP